MTASQRLESILRKGGASPKECNVYGRHGCVTFWSHDAAIKAARMLQAASIGVRGPVESVDYHKDNKGTNLNPSIIRVWRVGLKF